MKIKLPLFLALVLSLIFLTGWSPNASHKGSKTSVETLRTSLMTAVRTDNTEEASRLIQMGADPNSRTTPNGWSVLHYAVRNGNAEIGKALLQPGATPNYTGTMEGQTGSIISEKPLEIAKAALDLVNQVSPSTMEEIGR